MNAARPLLLATFAVVSACAPAATSHSCTLVGCEDGVSVDVGPLATRFGDKLPLAVHVCVDAVCDDVTIASANDCHRTAMTGPSGPVPPLVILCVPGSSGGIALRASVTGGLTSGSHVVAVTIAGGDGTGLYSHADTVTLTESRPNGPTCDPVCHQGSVVMHP